MCGQKVLDMTPHIHTRWALPPISTQVVLHFLPTAEQLLSTKDPASVLAAALAHISGYTSIRKRSLLNSSEGFTTFIMTLKNEMRTVRVHLICRMHKLGSGLHVVIQNRRREKQRARDMQRMWLDWMRDPLHESAALASFRVTSISKIRVSVL